MKTRLWLAISLVAVAAPVAQARTKVDSTEVQQAQTQQYVDARMHETLASIDRSLTTLVAISRGGELARKSGPIAATVAGAAGPARPAARPDALPVDPSVLERKVQIQWNGSADALLRSIAGQIGYSFSNNGRPLDTRVRIESKDLPLREVLNLVASQIDGQADIRVSLPDRSLALVRR